MGLIQNDLQIFGSIFSGNILHDLHIAFDQGQGRAQVVADIGDQLTLSLLHLAQIPGCLRELPVQLGNLSVGVRVENWRIFALTQGAGCFRGLDNGAGNLPGQDGGQQKADQQERRSQHPKFAADGLHRRSNRRYQRIEQYVVLVSVFQRGPLNRDQILAVFVIHGQREGARKMLPVKSAVSDALHGKKHKILSVLLQLLDHAAQVTMIQVMNDTAECRIGAVYCFHAFIHYQHAQTVVLRDTLNQRVQAGIVNVSGNAGRHVLKGAPLFVAVKLIQQLNLQQPQKRYHQHDKQEERPAYPALNAPKPFLFFLFFSCGRKGGVRRLLFQIDTPPLLVW